MPANPKYLSKSVGERIAKISAGFIGGYLVTVSAFIALSYQVAQPEILFTLQFAGFFVWAVLLMFAFLAKRGWKVWLLYSILTALFLVIIYLQKM